MEITIHKALSELKTMESRIRKAIISGDFIGIKKASADKVYKTMLSVEDFNKKAEAQFQSVVDLIARADELKKKITLSNATTKVIVNGIEMTVAEAIEMRKIIHYKKIFRDTLLEQYNNAISSLNYNNEKVHSNMESQNTALLYCSKDAKIKNDDLLTFENVYLDSHKWDEINPLKIQDKIEELNSEIDGFEVEIDDVLSTSNGITTISID